MRVLNEKECNAIGGGGQGGRPATVAPFLAQNANIQQFSAGGWTTTVVCSSGFSAGVQVVMNGAGRAFTVSGGVTGQLPQNCTITTLNEKTGVERICDVNSKDCKTYDKDGHQISDISGDYNGDTGLEALWTNLDGYDGPDGLLAGGGANLYESGSEPGYLPAFVANGDGIAYSLNVVA